VAVNPAGETKVTEARTSETKRFLANRNGILLVAKNAQHVFLLLLLPHLVLLLLEAIVALIVIRRWRFVRKSYFEAIIGAVRLMPQVRQWRRRTRDFRKRGDFGMLRFLRLVPSRWVEVKKVLMGGIPKVDAK
jgi:hypothetical protein